MPRILDRLVLALAIRSDKGRLGLRLWWICADSDDAGRQLRSDPGHHSDMMPAGLSLIAGM
jgi:hypothetical protein